MLLFLPADNRNYVPYFFDCIFSKSFWNKVMEKILKKLSNCGCLSFSYQDIITGVLKEEIHVDLFNYI